MREDGLSVLPIKKLLVAPLERLSDAPTWGWAAAWLGGAWQWLRGDAFSSLLGLIVLIAGADYYYGTKAARLANKFSPTLAQRGWHGKMSGLVLLLGIRLFEGWAAAAHLVDSKGGIATAIGIALLTVGLRAPPRVVRRGPHPRPVCRVRLDARDRQREAAARARRRGPSQWRPRCACMKPRPVSSNPG